MPPDVPLDEPPRAPPDAGRASGRLTACLIVASGVGLALVAGCSCDAPSDIPWPAPTKAPVLAAAHVNEELGDRENLRTKDDRRLVLGSVGRRAWAIALTMDPGVVGDVNYIHEEGYGGSNLGSRILGLQFSEGDAPLTASFLEHRYWPDHLQVANGLGLGGLVLSEEKFITADDCIVDVMRLDNDESSDHTVDVVLDGGLLAGLTIQDGIATGSRAFHGVATTVAAAARGLLPATEALTVNAAHNPRGFGLPTVEASFTFASDSTWEVIDGSHDPESRWTAWSTPNEADSITVDLGDVVPVDRIIVDFYDDTGRGGQVAPPRAVEVQLRDVNGRWMPVSNVTANPSEFTSGLHELTFTQRQATAVRLVVTHQGNGVASGIVEIEVYPTVERRQTVFRGSLTATAGSTATATVALCLGLPSEDVARSARFVIDDETPLATHAARYESWFDEYTPQLIAPDPYFERLWWYRWFVVRYNLAEIGTGHLLRPAFYEGREYYSRVIQFSTPHILDETRWLRDGRFAYGHIENMIDEAFAPFTGQFDGELPYLYVNAKSDFWFINWIEHAAWGLYKVHPREDFGTRFLPAFERDVRGQLRRYDTDGDRLPKLGGIDTAFYATGMEYQPAFYFFTGDMHQDPTTYPDIERTDFTAYWYGNARAMAEMENHFGDRSQAREFETLAAEIQSGAMSSMWHVDDGFFYDQREEDNEPARVAQVVGFFPFAFQLPPVDRLDTLRIFDQLIDPEAFWAPYPVSTISRKSAFFSQTSPGGCCHWNGPTWPFANTVVLNAVAEAVKGYGAAEHRQTFWDLLQAFTHEQFEGDDLTLPLVSESLNGDTGDWKSQVDSYFHSAWIDPVVRHVVGLTPRADDKIELQPIPNDWPYFALTRLSYHGRSLTVVWDAPDDADHFDDDWEGLAVWDGTTLLFSQERLEHVIFDPASGEVVTP